ncbi:hypothetical protein [Streptomyces ardesiacus]|uniref:hypothetical protein n=1 Tax=Streptomyces ardesiacus TaxID=285564 RepID=UPI003659E09F
MSVPKISNAREFAESVNELFALARPGSRDRVSDLLTALVAFSEKQATDKALDVAKEREAPAGMSRAEAVETAIKHVEKMSTNARGYQDGTNLAAKTQAVATFVELLMGEGTSSRE